MYTSYKPMRARHRIIYHIIQCVCVSVYVRFLSLVVRPSYVYIYMYVYRWIYITFGYVESV